MKKNLVIGSLSLALASTLFTGCGSSSSDDVVAAVADSIKGIVSDGPISGATVTLMEGNNTIDTAETNASGGFALSAILNPSKKYTLVSTGGKDIDTNEEFSGLNLKAPLAMFSDKEQSLVSPMTSLVEEEFTGGVSIEDAMTAVREKMGLSEGDLKRAPNTDLDLQKKAMKLSIMVKEGVTFGTIAGALDNTGGISDSDVDTIISDEEKRRLFKDTHTEITGAASLTDLKVSYKKKRYLREVINNGVDINISDDTQYTNLQTIATRFYDLNPNLSSSDITASLIGGIRQEDINVSINDFNASTFNVAQNLNFNGSLNILYYEVENPVTHNNQLLAYDYTAGAAYVVNTNVILKDKVFIFSGVKDGNKAKYTEKAYGMYLDPEQARETRVGSSRGRPFTYNFYTDNALMKFDAVNPSQTNYIYKSSDLPQSLKDDGILKIGSKYTIYENIVDIENSYVRLDGYDSLADTIRHEDENEKKHTYITVRLGDSNSVSGSPLAIVKGSDMTTTGLLISQTPAFIPSTGSGTYSLKLYNKELTSSTDIADGEFYFATQNDDTIYLYKDGSSKLWAFAKVGGNDLTEVSGITLAGTYNHDTHGKAARHAGVGVINGGNTLSGSNKYLSDGANAYLAFHYDLQEKIIDIFVFGQKGGYKHAQVFKVSGTSGSKIFDNGDANDDSFNPANTEANDGHINLIAVNGGKLYTEIGWNDGNASLGGTCTAGYPSGNNGKNCMKVKYGFLDTMAGNSVDDSTPLHYDDNNNSLDKEMIVTNIPYYVSRRVAPFASDGKLYISMFAGGTSSTGYKHNLYTFNLGDVNTSTKKEGRTYFVKSAKSDSGEYSGTVISWSKTTSKVTTPTGTVVADTSPLVNGGRSVSSLTNGVPLAGIGTIGMLKNDKGGHSFELFAVDAESNTNSFKAVDLAPFGGWIYE